ncbi:MAG: ATP--guanido phosphotransferase [Armatimonadota bacterium]
MKSRTAVLPDWISGAGPEADIVLSTRARLARGLAGFPFPERASSDDLAAVARAVLGACAGLTSRFPGLRSLRVERLDAAQRSFLLDARVASAQHISGGEGRIVIADPGGRLSIMVNEEDHIRLQAILAGLAPHEAWELVNWADDVLAQKLDYGFSERYGYLTASLSNVGTGLRISAMMHLAGLAMTQRLAEHLRAASDLGVSVRGAFGEGSSAAGDLYQVSNEGTLGMPESEIVERVRSVGQHLLDAERHARRELLEEQGRRLSDAAKRAVDKLSSSMSITSAEALVCISHLRLAVALGLVEGCSLSLVNQLMVAVQAAAGDGGGANIERAASLRRLSKTLRLGR